MNSIVFRAPDHVYIGDTSKHGLGGIAVNHGASWRWEIPEELRGRAHINILEFMVQLISIWIDILAGRIKSQDFILAIGDSTTAAGWLRRSNFRESLEKTEMETPNDWFVKQQVARKLATLILDCEGVLYSQWFKGKDNVVKDSLSRDLYF
jgi:hypothetical protein